MQGQEVVEQELQMMVEMDVLVARFVLQILIHLLVQVMRIHILVELEEIHRDFVFLTPAHFFNQAL
jgi:BarA-like signal transduction histidine kinase